MMLSAIGKAESESSKFRPVELEKNQSYFTYGSAAIQSGLSDDALFFAYSKFSRDDLIPVVFHDRPGIGAYEFVTVFRDPASHTLGAFVENPDTLQWDLEGMMWITDLTRSCGFTKATVGMGFWKGVTDRDRITTYAQLGLEWCFDRLEVDVVYGSTPAENRAAVIFGKHLGFQQTGPLEDGCIYDGKLSPVMFSSMTKHRWAGLRPWKEA